MYRLRFEGSITAPSLDGKVVTIVSDHHKQPPADWNMPRVYDIVAEDGTAGIAFADELMIEAVA